MELNRTTAAQTKTYPTRILQFGEGNFLRAFTDWMVNHMNHEVGFNAGIDIVQPRPQGSVVRLNEQQGLYHVYLKGIKEGQPVKEYTLIDCINRGINPYSEYEVYEKSFLNPELRFVFSNTTEAGVVMEESDTLAMKPQRSFPGKVAALLYHRYKAFNGDNNKGLIFIPCELIDKNGDTLKNYVLKHAINWQLGDDFIHWVNQSCAFCNTLVDRIVPGFPKEEIQQIHEELGYHDQLVVVGEYFHFLVIEAPEWVQQEFPAAKAGLHVKFVSDITPYREQKVLVLNGCHTGSFAVSYLSGLETVLEAFEDPEVGKFMRELVYEEVVPVLQGDKEELKAFAHKILERFSNPYIRHLWQSIALNAMSKWETRNLPTVLKYYQAYGKLPQRQVFSLAGMIAYFKGEVNGQSYPMQDDQWILDFYKQAWGECDGSPVAVEKLVAKVLALEKVWKQDLNHLPGFTATVSQFLFLIEQSGMKEAVKTVIRNQ
jgi:tagaturonate reductase